MQRVRIGLTGLAFVFLAVLLAAVFTGRTANEAPITPNTIEQQQKGVASTTPAPGRAGRTARDDEARARRLRRECHCAATGSRQLRPPTAPAQR